jgi:branched-subunit amino acid aminotransferase/4-amino-4-deoxychorismate lyase
MESLDPSAPTDASRPITGGAPPRFLALELDGAPPDTERLARLALANDGHFSVAQVRGGRIRGLELHLRRLDAATRELYDQRVDGEQVRALVRQALGGTGDATVRITVFAPDGDSPPILVTVRPPVAAPSAPETLTPVEFERPLAHIKHVGTFAQIHHARLAERRGFDDALLVTGRGLVAETTAANIAFVLADSLVWPEAPQLRGIGLQLAETVAGELGIASVRRPVSLSDVGTMNAAFLTSSTGIAPVSRIGEVEVRTDSGVVQALASAYERLAGDEV